MIDVILGSLVNTKRSEAASSFRRASRRSNLGHTEFSIDTNQTYTTPVSITL